MSNSKQWPLGLVSFSKSLTFKVSLILIKCKLIPWDSQYEFKFSNN